MTNTERLIDYYQHLFKILNENGYRLSNKFTKVDRIYTVETEDLRFNHTDLIINPIAYNFLKENSFIKDNICHLCGEYPIDNSYTFKTPFNDIKVNICKGCYTGGRKIQGKPVILPKKKSGCLVIILITGIIFSFLSLFI